jgi:hypothetical protein
MSGVEDADAQRRKYKAPYTPSHTIPTIQSYKKEKEQREAGAEIVEGDGLSRKERAQEAYETWKEKDPRGEPDHTDVYPTNNQNAPVDDAIEDPDHQEIKEEEEDAKKEFEDTTEQGLLEHDPKAQRKKMKHRGNDRAEREVTDPVTHLPVSIHDFTVKDLEKAPENVAPPRTGTGLMSKSDDELANESVTQKRAHRGMQSLFPTPDFDACGQEIAKIHCRGMIFGLGLVLTVMIGLLLLEKLFDLGSRVESKVLRRESAGKSLSSALLLLLGAALGAVAIWAVRNWTNRKLQDVWERHTWEAERQQGKVRIKQDTPESTQWLNEMLSSVWPLINPDLFISLADTLEVSMVEHRQAVLMGTDTMYRMLCKPHCRASCAWYLSMTLAKAANPSVFWAYVGSQQVPQLSPSLLMASLENRVQILRNQTGLFQAKAKSRDPWIRTTTTTH